MARPPTSPKIKMLRGNPGRRPIPTDLADPPVVMPEMPAWLKPYPIAVREWKREAKLLYDMKVLTEADVSLLANRCFIASEIQVLIQKVQTEGYCLIVEGRTGIAQAKVNPNASALQRYLTEYRAIGSTLGLDPAARNKIHTEPPTKAKDPFDDL